MQQIQSTRLYVCGSGGSGQLLTGQLDDQHEFIEVQQDIIKNILKFKVNGMYGGIIKQDGELYLWGENYLGCDSKPIIHYIPKLVQIPSKVKNISCGWNHTLILTEFSLYGIGSNKFFELGMEETKIFSQPVKLKLQIGDQKLKNVFAGFRQSFILTNQDNVYGCGNNKFGEIGDLEKQVKQFTLLPLPSGVKRIKCGQKHTLLQTEQGYLYGWGDNTFGQLGQGKDIKILKTTKIAEDVEQFDTGWSHHIILRNIKPYVQITGRGDFGQIGNGKLDHQFYYFNLDNMINNPELTNRVKAGALSSYVIQENQIFQTGWNEHGNLCTGNTENIISWTKLNLYGQGTLVKVALNILKNNQFKPIGASCFIFFST